MAKLKGRPPTDKEFMEVPIKLRKMFGLKQYELAELLSTTKTTVSAWETTGVSGIPSKATPFVSMIQLISLVRQARAFPEFLSFDKLKAYVTVTVRGELPSHYVKYVGKYIEEHFLNALKVPNVIALIFALEIDRYLERLGVETPEKAIVQGGLAEDMNDFFSEEVVLGLFDEEGDD